MSLQPKMNTHLEGGHFIISRLVDNVTTAGNKAYNLSTKSFEGFVDSNFIVIVYILFIYPGFLIATMLLDIFKSVFILSWYENNLIFLCAAIIMILKIILYHNC
jgi:hypothetical protein